MGLYDYEWFKSGFLSMSGIDLNSYKEGQMKRRIDNFLKKHQVDDYNTFLSLLRQDTEIHDSFITYLTINVSEFYRNPLQWQTLEKDIIPLLLKRFPKPLRIWSAACSTGDEPYSLAMVLSDFLPLSQVQILATDMDAEVLAKAKAGCYTGQSIKGLPQRYRDKFLEKDEHGIYRVSNKLKSCISFKQHNLLKDGYPQRVHLIVCRNVMIYFTEEAKDEIYQKFQKSLTTGGVLFIGSTEQIMNYKEIGFNRNKSFFFEKA